MNKHGRMKWMDFRNLRKAKRYTQAAFGKLLGMSQAAVSRHEREDGNEYVEADHLAKGLAAPALPAQPYKRSKTQGRVTSALSEPLATSEGQSWPIAFAPGRKPLPPGMELVELVPSQLRAGQDYEQFPRNFTAWPVELPPSDNEAPPNAPAEVTGDAGTAVASSPTREASNARLRHFPGRPAMMFAASLAIFILPAGCFFAHRGTSTQVPSLPAAPAPAPSVEANRATGLENTPRTQRPATADDDFVSMLSAMWGITANPDVGERVKVTKERWVPNEPLPHQKKPPCDASVGQATINGGCWFSSGDLKPPCKRLWRYEDKCYIPIAEDPKQPITEAPSK